jgi:UDPglucose 6-dehydrogenase
LPEARNVEIFSDPFKAMCNSDAVVLLTEWPEFLNFDFAEVADHMRGNIIIDGRNALDPEAVLSAGLIYEGFGRYAART